MYSYRKITKFSVLHQLIADFLNMTAHMLCFIINFKVICLWVKVTIWFVELQFTHLHTFFCTPHAF